MRSPAAIRERDTGLEGVHPAEMTELSGDSRMDDPTRVDAKCAEAGGHWPKQKPDRTGAPASIEDALAGALSAAAGCGRWDVVSQLAKELEARRLALGGVTSLDDVRARRDRPR